MSRYTLNKRSRTIELGWDPGGFGTFFAQVYSGDPENGMELWIGVPPRLTRSIEEFQAWLAPYTSLSRPMRQRLLRDQRREEAVFSDHEPSSNERDAPLEPAHQAGDPGDGGFVRIRPVTAAQARALFHGACPLDPPAGRHGRARARGPED